MQKKSTGMNLGKKISKIYFIYEKAVIRTFHTSFLTTQKPLNVHYKYFWYTKINRTQIAMTEFN